MYLNILIAGAQLWEEPDHSPRQCDELSYLFQIKDLSRRERMLAIPAKSRARS